MRRRKFLIVKRMKKNDVSIPNCLARRRGRRAGKISALPSSKLMKASLQGTKSISITLDLYDLKEWEEVLMSRTDERDIIFSRLNYKEGSPEYLDYYRRNPHLEERDRRLREPPSKEGNPSYEPLNTPIGDSVFQFLADIKKKAEGPVLSEKVEVDPQKMTDKLKGMSVYYGASLVGVARLDETFYYSHRGRESEVYGEEITQYHNYALVFAVELNKDMIDTAPFSPESVEVTKGYLDAAVVGMVISYYLRTLGYEARNHMDGNYLMPLPSLAAEAGLGEMGKIGVLVTKEFGPRIRLGAVTTNMELVPDQKKPFGLLSFCNQCNNCVLRCPSSAIPMDPVYEGRQRKISEEACFTVWKRVFTDCGICLASCPFSTQGDILKKETPPYNKGFVREQVEKHNIELLKKLQRNERPYHWLEKIEDL